LEVYDLIAKETDKFAFRNMKHERIVFQTQELILHLIHGGVLRRRWRFSGNYGNNSGKMRFPSRIFCWNSRPQRLVEWFV